MTDRFPLIANPTTKQIEELASGDNLNLQNSGIVGATTITANKFVGDLQGNATSADTLNNAENITTGTISTSRLSGSYDIDITGNAGTATTLSNAANITTGTISSSRLSGTYPINITGQAYNAINLDDAANITTGIINSDRLTGTYNINVTSAATASNLTVGTYNVDISGNAATATTAINVISGVASVTNLTVSPGITTLGFTTVTELNCSGIVSAGDFNTTSDINLKTNIQQFDESLSKVIQIRGVTFDWKESNRSSAGVIAQEVEKVLPELVSGGDNKTVNYNGITGALIEAIKELKAENDIMKQRLDEVYKKVFG